MGPDWVVMVCWRQAGSVSWWSKLAPSGLSEVLQMLQLLVLCYLFSSRCQLWAGSTASDPPQSCLAKWLLNAVKMWGERIWEGGGRITTMRTTTTALEVELCCVTLSLLFLAQFVEASDVIMFWIFQLLQLWPLFHIQWHEWKKNHINREIGSLKEKRNVIFIWTKNIF